MGLKHPPPPSPARKPLPPPPHCYTGMLQLAPNDMAFPGTSRGSPSSYSIGRRAVLIQRMRSPREFMSPALRTVGGILTGAGSVYILSKTTPETPSWPPFGRCRLPRQRCR